MSRNSGKRKSEVNEYGLTFYVKQCVVNRLTFCGVLSNVHGVNTRNMFYKGQSDFLLVLSL